MNDKIYCVALLIADDGQSSAICQKHCDVDQLEELKKDHNKGHISLIGWIPYGYYTGGDVRKDDKNFVWFD